jgi:hypothetical protein
MASKREQIILAFIAALEVASVGATTKPTGLTVHRSPLKPVAEDALPAQAVFWADDPAEEGDLEQMDHMLELVVESRAKAAAGQSPETALDPLYVWAVKAAMADPTLGGLALRVLERDSVPDLEQRSATFGALQTAFHIMYETLDADPES